MRRDYYTLKRNSTRALPGGQTLARGLAFDLGAAHSRFDPGEQPSGVGAEVGFAVGGDDRETPLLGCVDHVLQFAGDAGQPIQVPAQDGVELFALVGGHHLVVRGTGDVLAGHRVVHVLPGVRPPAFACDDCGEPVSGWSGGRYRCKAACVNRAKPAVDKFVREVIAERLSRDDVADLLAPTERNIAPLLERVESLRARLATIDADYDAGIIDGLRHRSATDRVRAELDIAERELSSQRTGSALGELLATGNPSAAFLDAGLMSQRAVIDTLCTVRLRRGTRGSKVFDPNTVQIAWRE